MIRCLLVSAGVATAALLAIAGPVSAHIDPDPETAQAGSRLTVGFTVEHGCVGSPTVQLDMRLPEGVVDPVPAAVDGWEGSVDAIDGATIVTFAGGPLADDVEGTFSVTMTLPSTPDATIYFPFVQRCEVGEIRWIGIPTEPGDELDEPAPAMSLTGPVATVPTTAPVTASTEVATTDPDTADVTGDPITTASTDPLVGTTAVPGSTEPLLIAGADGETGSSDTGTLIFVGTIAAVLAIGGFVVYRSRQARADNARDDT